MTSITESDSDVASSALLEPLKKQYSDLSSHDEEASQPASSVVQQEEEEGSDGDGHRTRATQISPLCVNLICISGLVLFIGLLCLSIWVRTLVEPKPVSAVSLEVESFYVGQGSDASGVPTKLVSVKCSFMIYVYNSFSKDSIWVASSSVDLFYKDIAIAKGQLKKFYLSKHIGETASVYLVGEKVPLYKEGADFSLNCTNGAVPLRLELDVFTWRDTLWPPVEVKYSHHVSCSINLDFAKITKPIELDDKACNYS